MDGQQRGDGGERGEEEIADLPGLVEAGRAERAAQSALGEVRQVERKMTPPDAVVVPEMMIGVASRATHRDF